MNLLKQAIRSHSALRRSNPNSALSFRQLPKPFSTGAEQPLPSQDFSVAPFLQNSGKGRVYARLSPITIFTLKTDIISLFEGCKLTPDDVKVLYNRGYTPLGVMVQFPSVSAYDAALKIIKRKSRIFKLEKLDRSVWENFVPYDRNNGDRAPQDITHDGKTVLLRGIPMNAMPEDVERLLSGCQYDSPSTHLYPIGRAEKVALVRFHSKTEAMNAVITKNHGFCLNGRVTMRVLQ